MTPEQTQELKALLCEGCRRDIPVEQIAGYPSHRNVTGYGYPQICQANYAVIAKVNEWLEAELAAKDAKLAELRETNKRLLNELAKEKKWIRT